MTSSGPATEKHDCNYMGVSKTEEAPKCVARPHALAEILDLWAVRLSPMASNPPRSRAPAALPGRNVAGPHGWCWALIEYIRT